MCLVNEYQFEEPMKHKNGDVQKAVGLYELKVQGEQTEILHFGSSW